MEDRANIRMQGSFIFRIKDARDKNADRHDRQRSFSDLEIFFIGLGSSILAVALSLSKSNRSGQDADLIEFNKDFLTVSGKIEKDDLKKNLEVYIDNYRKKVSINGKEIHRIKDYISKAFGYVNYFH